MMEGYVSITADSRFGFTDTVFEKRPHKNVLLRVSIYSHAIVFSVVIKSLLGDREYELVIEDESRRPPESK